MPIDIARQHPHHPHRQASCLPLASISTPFSVVPPTQACPCHKLLLLPLVPITCNNILEIFFCHVTYAKSVSACVKLRQLSSFCCLALDHVLVLFPFFLKPTATKFAFLCRLRQGQGNKTGPGRAGQLSKRN